ncbi:hypothetical protein G6011_09101 [Alternaria panax]|uniref:Uncharacterized protein n=1 Tax=Alternaria panax TaxID=48097 RepID=A0AAD4IAF0_9PLEO|nr:hypothetical protein G6011_09101 [Alternaria panax]
MASDSLIPRGQADFDLYRYTPSRTAGYALLVLFAIGGLAHLIMLIPLRSWFFIPFVLGCVSEAVGYYGRAWFSSDIRNGSPYLIQLMLILAAAPLLAATTYMTLGRLIRALDATHHAVLKPRWTTKIHVIIDVGSFRYMWALYGVSMLVVVRSIFRLAESVEKPESKVYQTEAYL